MKTGFCFICFVFCFVANAQTIQCKVFDVDDKKPLYFATITYGKDSKITFSDSLGNFYLSKDILNTADSLTIDFVGYASSKIASKHIIPNQSYFLIKNKQILEEVVVKNCKEYEEVNTNYIRKGNSHWSISPFLPFAIIGYYPNTLKQEGYIKQFHFYTSTSDSKKEFYTPIRLHWYSFDSLNNNPGKDLSDTSIIIYPTKRGLNTVDLPNKLIYFGKEGVVIGIEFLYSHQQELDWEASKKKVKWDWIANNSWHFQTTHTKQSLEGWYGAGKWFNVFKLHYSPDAKLEYVKPYFNFTIKTCKR